MHFQKNSRVKRRSVVDRIDFQTTSFEGVYLEKSSIEQRMRFKFTKLICVAEVEASFLES